MIYTVKNGDTLYKISKQFSIPLDYLIDINGITDPDKLAIGQNLLVTPIRPTAYTVERGDTMYKISRMFNISLNDLITANPQITDPNKINIGDTINIPNPLPIIDVNGYGIASITPDTIEKVSPALTYLSLFSYQAKEDGSLTQLYETSLIETARNNTIAPIMVVTNIGETGGFSSELAHTILTTPEIQNTLINNIIGIVSDKNYYGVDIDFEYLFPSDKDNYMNFLRTIKAELNKINTPLSVAVAPKYRDNQMGILYEAHDYQAIGEIADRVIIMTYEWGYKYGEPMAVSPYDQMDAVLSYAVTRIPSNKILMGMPNYGYDWKIPYTQGDVATTLNNTQALNLAIEKGSTIQFDEKSKTPFFEYLDGSQKHIVWFDDPKSIDAKLDLIAKHNLAGISYWTINYYYAPQYSVLLSKYNVRKL